MANEHIKTAAANLQRAAQDVREEKHRLQNSINSMKRDAENAIRKAEQQIMQLHQRLTDQNVDESMKIAASLQQQNLRGDIAQIKKNTDQQERDLTQQINGMDGQESEFESLASHLNNIA